IGIGLNAAILLIPVYRIVLRRRRGTLADLGFVTWRPGSLALISGALIAELGFAFLWLKLFKTGRHFPNLYFGRGFWGYLLAIVLGSGACADRGRDVFSRIPVQWLTQPSLAAGGGWREWTAVRIGPRRDLATSFRRSRAGVASRANGLDL